MYRLMGVIEFKTAKERKLKVIGNKDGVVIKHTLKHPGKDITYKQLTDIIVRQVKVKLSDIQISKHIEQSLKAKE